MGNTSEYCDSRSQRVYASAPVSSILPRILTESGATRGESEAYGIVPKQSGGVD